jgi:hypothetical protein
VTANPNCRHALVVDAIHERNQPAVEAFERAGWIARTATSRAAALNLLGEGSYSAAVLYPGRLAGTGFDAVAAIRRQCRALPIAVVLGPSRTAGSDPRLLWFASRNVDESIHRTVIAACRSSARATRRRDLRATVPVDPHELPAIAEPEPPRTPLRALRDLDRVQLGAWLRLEP